MGKSRRVRVSQEHGEELLDKTGEGLEGASYLVGKRKISHRREGD